MSTDAKNVVSEAKTEAKEAKAKASGKGKRGRQAKPDYPIPEGETLTSVPTDFSEDKYKLIPESGFSTTKLHREFMLSVRERQCEELRAEIEQLDAVPEELQSDMAAVVGGISRATSGLKNIQSGCEAKLKEAEASGDADAIKAAKAAKDKADAELARRVQEALSSMGLA